MKKHNLIINVMNIYGMIIYSYQKIIMAHNVVYNHHYSTIEQYSFCYK
jgi:hypothetical protein